jgi:hypothetical protein
MGMFNIKKNISKLKCKNRDSKLNGNIFMHSNNDMTKTKRMTKTVPQIIGPSHFLAVLGK